MSLSLLISLWICPIVFADHMSSGSESDKDYVIWENACKKERQQGRLQPDLVHQWEKNAAASPYATERDRSAALSDNWPGHHIALEHTEPKTVLQKGIKEQAVHFVTAADLLLTMKLTTSRSNNQTVGHTPIQS